MRTLPKTNCSELQPPRDMTVSCMKGTSHRDHVRHYRLSKRTHLSRTLRHSKEVGNLE